jgi:hypothetical protein
LDGLTDSIAAESTPAQRSDTFPSRVAYPHDDTLAGPSASTGGTAIRLLDKETSLVAYGAPNDFGSNSCKAPSSECCGPSLGDTICVAGGYVGKGKGRAEEVESPPARKMVLRKRTVVMDDSDGDDREPLPKRKRNHEEDYEWKDEGEDYDCGEPDPEAICEEIRTPHRAPRKKLTPAQEARKTETSKESAQEAYRQRWGEPTGTERWLLLEVSGHKSFGWAARRPQLDLDTLRRMIFEETIARAFYMKNVGGNKSRKRTSVREDLDKVTQRYRTAIKEQKLPPVPKYESMEDMLATAKLVGIKANPNDNGYPCPIKDLIITTT